MTAILESIEAVLKPWSDWYSHSKLTQAGIEYLHVGGLLVGGGFALASDRAALHSAPTQRTGGSKTELVTGCSMRSTRRGRPTRTAACNR